MPKSEDWKLEVYKFGTMHSTGGYAEVSITAGEILEHMRRPENHNGCPELSDIEAIKEFVAVNWAYSVSKRDIEENVYHPAGLPWGIITQ